MVTRNFVLVLVTVGGCATAADVQPDAPKHDQAHPDAAVGHDGPAGSIDAPVAQGSCATPFSGVLATWTFTGETGSQATTTAASSATGMTASVVSRAASLTTASGANSINSTSWATAAARDLTKYYAVTITPPAGCQLDLTAAAIDAKSSGTGPASAVVATSADTFTQTATVSTAAASTPTLAVTGATTAVELRIYGYAASSPSGTMRLQTTLSITGSLR